MAGNMTVPFAAQGLIAAQFDDIVGLIITLSVIGFSILSQILGDRKKRKPPPQPPGGSPSPQTVESEIEAFLRQARGDAPAKSPSTPPPAPQSRRQPIEVMPMEVDEAMARVEPGRSFARDLSDHVDEHIGRDAFSRTSELAQATEFADERMEQHLEDVFEHDVGSIHHVEEVNYDIAEGTDDHSWEEKKKVTSDVAGEIAALMKSPDSVRKMFIMTEVLKRPEI